VTSSQHSKALRAIPSRDILTPARVWSAATAVAALGASSKVKRCTGIGVPAQEPKAVTSSQHSKALRAILQGHPNSWFR